MSIPVQESDTVEFKESWSDKALKDLAAFANTQGGTVYVGIRDDGVALGTPGDDQQQLLVANQIDSKLRISADVSVKVHADKRLLAVSVPRAQRLVRFDGRYYRRVGTASMEMSEEEVANRMSAQAGQTWDAVPVMQASIENDIDPQRVHDFVLQARRREPLRLPAEMTEQDPIGLILRNLDLLVEDYPTRAALLLFGKNPQRFFKNALIRPGFFRDLNNVNDYEQFPDCRGTIFEQIDSVMRQITNLYPTRMVFPAQPALIGGRRVETPSFPEPALLEAIINACVHRDYAEQGAEIEVKMFPDFIWIANPGGLMPGVTVASLKVKPHLSRRRNPLLAQALFVAHKVERYGTGTVRMTEACRAAGLPDPEFSDTGGAFEVTLRRQSIKQESIVPQALNARQRSALDHISAHGGITPVEYQQLFGVSDRTASRELRALMKLGILVREGTRQGLRYIRSS